MTVMGDVLCGLSGLCALVAVPLLFVASIAMAGEMVVRARRRYSLRDVERWDKYELEPNDERVRDVRVRRIGRLLLVAYRIVGASEDRRCANDLLVAFRNGVSLRECSSRCERELLPGSSVWMFQEFDSDGEGDVIFRERKDS